GIIPLAVFMVVYPISNEIEHVMRIWGLAPPRVERLLPWLHDSALASFLVYFVLYDFAAYWLHRAQHKFSWWWALHSLHHSQHHALASADERHIQDHNFAPVFPIWDMLFGTANYDGKHRPTGVDDPVVDADNGRGWLVQQVTVAGRFLRALAPRFRRASIQ